MSQSSPHSVEDIRSSVPVSPVATSSTRSPMAGVQPPPDSVIAYDSNDRIAPITLPNPSTPRTVHGSRITVMWVTPPSV